MEQQIVNGDYNTNKHDIGKMNYGCAHYRRRCKVRAPCCNQIFSCRHCHNEFTSALSNPKERHELVRHEIKQVVCEVCEIEQPVAHICSNCGVKMGEYFCNICKFYDDDTSKQQFHCDACGICRVGGRDNFFHCKKCASCYAVELLDNHSCVENSMKSHCPICYEFLFDSVQGTMIMKCGHTIHFDCFREMTTQNQYRCPICSRSVVDMSNNWQRLDIEMMEQLTNVSQRLEDVEARINTVDATDPPANQQMEGEASGNKDVEGREQPHGEENQRPEANTGRRQPRQEEQVEATPMPKEYRYQVPILCNDCNSTSRPFFHFVGHKCSHCNSYNTRMITMGDNQQR